ncbi:hypothetical protein CHS0354_022530 [Potamilus streckersoni]|uniref:Thyroid transcription factor 1-associated protein 26 n=1 Tax=Potamilus streckersoni TaxID=2493646 RepID=A0AAE0S710_9BIVA|nr:hypothetical protein CHS0354_022530 [Potamilus streckersoni]
MESDRKKYTSKNRTRAIKSAKYKQFFGNQIQGQGFADKRKKKIQYEYLKFLKKENRRTEKTVLDGDAADCRKQRGFSAKSGRHKFSKAHEEYERRKQIKLDKKEVALKKKRELAAALDKYKQRKKEKFKKLCKKTYKGQPVMKDRIEHLLEKIQRQVNQT